MKKLLSLAVISALSIAGFIGCAANAPGAGRNNDGFGLLNADSDNFGKMHANFMGFLKDLNLSDSQKAQFKELKDSVHGQFNKNDGKRDEFKNTLKEAFLSNSIDKAALKAKLISLQPQNDDRLTLMANNLIKAYNILTPEQRTKIENKANEMEKKMNGFMNNPVAKFFKGDPNKRIEKLTAKLNLTDSQKESVKSLFNEGMPDRKAMLDKAGKIKTAVFTELKSANPSSDKIKNILQDAKSDMQSNLDSRLDKLVKVHDILTVEQRQKLVEIMEKGNKRFKGKGKSFFHH